MSSVDARREDATLFGGDWKMHGVTICFAATKEFVRRQIHDIAA
jgi:hypothetical protein